MATTLYCNPTDKPEPKPNNFVSTYHALMEPSSTTGDREGSLETSVPASEQNVDFGHPATIAYYKIARFYSRPLNGAQTIGGETITCYCHGFEDVATANAEWEVEVGVWKADDTGVRGWIGHTAGAFPEMNADSDTETSGAFTGTSVAAQDGDRIIVEILYWCTAAKAETLSRLSYGSSAKDTRVVFGTSTISFKGETYSIDLNEAAISFSDAVSRQLSRPLSESAVSILAETLARAVQRQLSEASISIPTETLTRLVSRALSEPSLSFTDAVEKSVQRNISLNEAVVSIVAETLAREVRRTLSEAAVSIPAETLIRFISRALSEPSISFSDSLARQVLRLLAEPTVSIPAETLRREINRALSETSVSIPQELLARYISRALSEPSQAFSDSLAREAQRILSEVAISASDALEREVQRALLEPSIPFSDSLIRMVSVSLSETSLTFSDDIQIEVVPGGPPPPAGKRVKVHVWPATPVHTPKVM